jgi:hypothetical protein
MPNHVTTRCIVTGPTADIQYFRNTTIRVPEGGDEPTLDFDRIIPMPDVIKNTDGATDIDLGIEILIGSPRPDMPLSSYLTWSWIQQLGISTVAELRAWAEKERPEALVSGRKALEAFKETGCYDWYGWSVENWETKWNSYGFQIEYEDDEQLSFHFNTAWGFPSPIFDTLAEMFPTLRFDCVCFDEMWNFAGQGSFNGEPSFEFVDPTDELYEMVYGGKPIWSDLTDTSPASEPESNTIASVLIRLDRCMSSLLSLVVARQFRVATESAEWRGNEALRDLDCALNSGIDDFLLGPELDNALLSLKGKATSVEYRFWLADYLRAEEQLDRIRRCQDSSGESASGE